MQHEVSTLLHNAVRENTLTWAKTLPETYEIEIIYAPYSQLTRKYIFIKPEVAQTYQSQYDPQYSYASILCTPWAVFS